MTQVGKQCRQDTSKEPPLSPCKVRSQARVLAIIASTVTYYLLSYKVGKHETQYMQYLFVCCFVFLVCSFVCLYVCFFLDLFSFFLFVCFLVELVGWLVG